MPPPFVKSPGAAPRWPTADNAATVGAWFAPAAADTIGTTDVAIRKAVHSFVSFDSLGATEGLGTSDVATRGPAIRVRSAPDTLGTLDGGGPVLPSPFLWPRSTLYPGTFPQAQRLLLLAHNGADTLGTSDTATGVGIRARTAPDALGTTDVAGRAALVRARVAVDSLVTTDSATIPLSGPRPALTTVSDRAVTLVTAGDF